MACQTCDHTMHGIGTLTDGARVFWCPRCGSINVDRCHLAQGANHDTPKLVGRARDLLLAIDARKDLAGFAWRQGVHEAVGAAKPAGI